MAEATSAAPLSMIRNTTSRKPRNAATISDVEMAWLPDRARIVPKTGQDYDHRAESSISNHRPGRAIDGVVIIPTLRTPHILMPETPILILLAPSVASLDASKIARTPDGDPSESLGLSLIQRTVLAARARRLSSAGPSPRGKRARDRRGRRHCRLARPRRDALISYSSAGHCARRHPRGNRLARTAGFSRDRGGRLGGDPEPDRHASRRVGAGRGGCAGSRTAARETWPLSRIGSPAAWPAGADSRRDRSDGRGDARGRPRGGAAPPQGAGQGHRRVHGAACRAADLASDFAPPRGNRDHAQSDEPDFHCGRNLRRAVFPVLAPLDANDRGAAVSRPFDPRRLRRRTGEAQIPAIAMGRRPRFLGRQRRSHGHLRLHGRRLEPVRRRALAARARRRGRSRDTWARPASSIGG